MLHKRRSFFGFGTDASFFLGQIRFLLPRTPRNFTAPLKEIKIFVLNHSFASIEIFAALSVAIYFFYNLPKSKA